MSARIGIIGAMQVEINLLVGQLQDQRCFKVADMVFYEGSLQGTPVVVVRSGVGKVSAASCTQALIDRFSPTHVINTGIAGALVDMLDIGDLVVSTDLVQHDMDVTGLGYAPGVIPELDDFTHTKGKLAFEADKWLQQVVKDVAAEVADDITVVSGRIASGDLFVSTPEARKRIANGFDALCCEMEGAAIAQTCWRNATPFVVVRAISDKADTSSAEDYPAFEQRIAEHCAAIVSHATARLSEERS